MVVITFMAIEEYSFMGFDLKLKLLRDYWLVEKFLVGSSFVSYYLEGT